MINRDNSNAVGFVDRTFSVDEVHCQLSNLCNGLLSFRSSFNIGLEAGRLVASKIDE